MSRRGFELLIGGVILLVLALKAPLVLSCGLAYVWWVVHRAQGDVRVDAAARAALIGGFAGSMLLGVLFFVLVPLLAGTGSLELTRDFILDDASRTSLGLFWVGMSALFQSFLLGVSIRLIGPWLPR
jgi:hypothetical protein